jgi:hypothetical protein
MAVKALTPAAKNATRASISRISQYGSSSGIAARIQSSAHCAASNPSAAPGHGQQDAFCKRRPHQARAPRSHGGTHRDITLPLGAAHQHQVGQVRADDEQNEAHGTHHQRGTRALLASDIGRAKGCHADAEVAVRVGRLCREARRNRRELGLCLLDGDARRSLATALTTRDERGVSSNRNGRYSSSRSGNFTPGGSAPTTVRARSFTTMVRPTRVGSAPYRLPQSVRENDGILEAGRGGLLIEKLAAQHRLDAEQRKQSWRDRPAQHALGARLVAREYEVPCEVAADAVERPGMAEVERSR